MKRRFRLANSKDIQRVRLLGKSYAHPLIVLVTLPNEMALPRIGVVAGRSIGGAVQRNRAKRHMRAAIGPLIASIQPGWDLMVIARPPIKQAEFGQIQSALASLLKRAGILNDTHGLGYDPSSSSG